MARFSDKLYRRAGWDLEQGKPEESHVPDWLKNKKAVRLKLAYVPVDMSLSQLDQLYNEGYRTVTWQTSFDPCARCQGLSGQVFDIEDFMWGLSHSAPIFERSHVGCRCTLLITVDAREESRDPYEMYDEDGWDWGYEPPSNDPVEVQAY